LTLLQGLIMGVVQGLTEFLPVSSSGHLALSRQLLGAGAATDVGFEVAVHAGTLLSVLIFFRIKIMLIIKEAVGGYGDGRRLIWYIFIGSLPAGIAGLLLKGRFEIFINNTTLVGYALCFTAVFLFIGERFAREIVSAGKMGVSRSIWIGIAQAVAIFPGVSRSGATIAASMLCGVKKSSAVDFAFLLSLPAVGGAILLTALDWKTGSVSVGVEHLAGGITAAISGYIAIGLILKIVAGGKLYWFSIYCIIIGVLVIVL